MATWLREDVVQALRAFARGPAFALAAVGTLALGIGATTTMFGVVDAILLKPLPYADADRLVQVGVRYDEFDAGSMSPPDFFDVAERTRMLEAVAASRLQWMDWTADGEPEQLDGAGVSASYFDIIGMSPVIGRSFRPADDRRGGEAVIVLSHGLWQRRYGGDRGVLGRTMVLNGAPWTIVGVMPSSFHGPEAIYHGRIELWFPLGRIEDPLDERDNAFLQVIGRLAEGRQLEAARAELESIGGAIGEADPEGGRRRFWVADLRERTVAGTGTLLWLLFGAVSLLLVIACANVAHLFLVRATERSREIAVRSAIGAGRGRIVRQLLTESTVLGLVAGLLGSLLAWLGVAAFRALGPGDLPRLAEVSVDMRVLAFALVISLVTGLAFGLVPALDAMRLGLSGVLRDAGTTLTGGRRRTRFRNALVVVQTSLAVVLLAGAGLLFNSFIRLSRVNPGFDPSDVVWIDVRLPQRYETADARRAFFDALLTRVGTIQGVRWAGAIHGRPLDRNQSITNVLPEGRTVGGGEGAPRTSWTVLTPGYFAALGIPLVAGRDITSADGAGASPVVVVSRSLAERFWPGENAVGKRIRMGQLTDDAPFLTIVGVAGDVLQFGLGTSPEPMVYRPYAQVPRTWLGLVVRHDGVPSGPLLAALRQAVWSIDPALPLEEYGTMDAHVRSSIGEPRFRALAFAAFSTVATLLAFVGLYATLAWLVRTRRRELGIRMALGAAAADVRKIVVVRGMTLALAGIALGLIGAIVASRLLASMVFGITTTDASTLLSVSTAMAVVAFVACWLPARRAGATDPARTLRQE
jgi:predicted permease